MMRIAVTGSIATDHLMRFPGKFADQMVAGHLAKVSLSFLVDDLEVRRGGTAANIAFGLGSLGTTPILVGAVGKDFTDHESWLHRHGVDTKSVLVSETRHTARFLCTTDVEQNQIASFYPGAMREARHIELRAVSDRVGTLGLVVVAPNDPVAMVRHTLECRELGYRFMADPSQQLATMSRHEVRSLVDGSSLLFTNEYEAALLHERTGWTGAQVLDRVGTWVTTLGAQGVRIDRRDQPALRVDAVPTERPVDPTGAGDGFRAGFLYGIGYALGIGRAAELGCLVATAVVESRGTQEYGVDRQGMSERAAATYGEPAAAEIESVVRV
jgi:adenosine kinase